MGVIGGAIALLIGCGLVQTTGTVGGESHFLGSCGNGCEDGLSCLGEICTLPCEPSGFACGQLGADISCRSSAAGLSGSAYCDLPCQDDSSCAAVGSQLVCREGFCRGMPAQTSNPLQPDLSDPWWCLGEEPQPLPELRPGEIDALVFPVLEWATRTSLAGRGLTAVLCPSVDARCQSPLAPPYLVRPGMIGMNPLPPQIPASATAVPVPEGFDGFIKLEVEAAVAAPAEQFVPLAYFLGGTISGTWTQGPPQLMTQQGVWAGILQSSFPGVDATIVQSRGSVEASVYDCLGQPVVGAQIELVGRGEVQADAIPYQLPASRIPIAYPLGQSLYTPSTGMVGYLNVPEGAVELRAYREDNPLVPIGTIQLQSVAGQFSVGMIRPAYFTDAAIPGTNVPLDGSSGAGSP